MKGDCVHTSLMGFRIAGSVQDLKKRTTRFFSTKPTLAAASLPLSPVFSQQQRPLCAMLHSDRARQLLFSSKSPASLEVIIITTHAPDP